jgi:hypothetical protein
MTGTGTFVEILWSGGRGIGAAADHVDTAGALR